MIHKRKRKKVKVRRLYKMQPLETAWVPYGANNRTFAVVKESDMELQFLEKAHSALAEVVKVVKSGNLDEAATEAVNQKIDIILGDLAKGGGMELDVSQTTVPQGLVDGLKDLAKGLKGLEAEVQPQDLTLADRLGAMAEKAEELTKEEAGSQEGEGEGEAAAASEGDSAGEQGGESQEGSEGEQEEQTAKDGAGAGSEGAAGDEGGSSEGEGDSAGADEDKGEGASDDVVTKADLTSFMTEVKELIGGLTKKTDEAVQVSKSVMQQIPGTQQVTTKGQEKAKEEAIPHLGGMDLTQDPALKDIELPE
jgi:hypothetical protein